MFEVRTYVVQACSIFCMRVQKWWIDRQNKKFY